jgi:hypothetical protein
MAEAAATRTEAAHMAAALAAAVSIVEAVGISAQVEVRAAEAPTVFSALTAVAVARPATP